MKLSTLLPDKTTRRLAISAWSGLSPVVSALRDDYEMASGSPAVRAFKVLRQNRLLAVLALVSTFSGLATRRLLAAKEEPSNRAIHQLLEGRTG